MIRNIPNAFTQQLIRECPFVINIELKQIKVCFVDRLWSDSGLGLWARENLQAL
jgi:hypothetical protein